LDYQIKRDEVETAGHTPVSEEKCTRVLVRKPKGKTVIEENAVVCVKELFSFHQGKIRTIHCSALNLWAGT
jgi:hypothetical protein